MLQSSNSPTRFRRFAITNFAIPSPAEPIPVLINARREQRAFVREYLIDLNVTQAAIRAGYSEKTAGQVGAENLRKPNIAAALDAAMKIRTERTDITADRVLKELAKIGFADIRKAIKWHSHLINEEDNPDGGDVAVIKTIVTNQVELVGSKDLDDETAAAISEISQNTTGGIKLKLQDKRAALVDIRKHLGMFKDQVEHSGEVAVTFQTSYETKPESERPSVPGSLVTAGLSRSAGPAEEEAPHRDSAPPVGEGRNRSARVS